MNTESAACLHAFNQPSAKFCQDCGKAINVTPREPGELRLGLKRVEEIAKQQLDDPQRSLARVISCSIAIVTLQWALGERTTETFEALLRGERPGEEAR